MLPWYSVLAFVSGFFAALASMFSKLAFGDVIEKKLCTQGRMYSWFVDDCSSLIMPFRGVMVFGLIASNVFMWRVFNRALSLSPTTLQITVVNTAANFLISAWIGAVIFDETFSTTWYMGVSFILIGLAILQHAASSASENEKMKTS